MAISNDTKEFLALIANECVEVASRTSKHVSKDVQKTTLLLNIINADVQAENPTQCVDCMGLFLDPEIVQNPNAKDNLSLSTYIRQGPCGALCSSTISTVTQDSSLLVDTTTDSPFTMSPENGVDLTTRIYAKVQDSGLPYVRKITKEQIATIVQGLDWATPMNTISTSSSASIINVVTAEGTGVRIAHVVQKSAVDAVFTQLLNSQLALVRSTLAYALWEESQELENFIDGTFTEQIGSAFQTNRSEFIAIGSLALVLLIAWCGVFWTRRRRRA